MLKILMDKKKIKLRTISAAMLVLEHVAVSTTRYYWGLIRCSAFIWREGLGTYKKKD